LCIIFSPAIITQDNEEDYLLGATKQRASVLQKDEYKVLKDLLAHVKSLREERKEDC